MALVGDDFYVANTDAVLRLPYQEGETRSMQSEATGEKIADLPAGTVNHHWTKILIASPGWAVSSMPTVGSNSNVGRERAWRPRKAAPAILEIDRATGRSRLFASGLRNPNGLAWAEATEALWTVVNERDELGGDLVPDYLTSVKDGAFYGWPYSYYGQHVDDRVEPQNPALVAKAIKPDYALGNHVAPLGLAFCRRRPAAGALSATAPSSASTARGTASRAAATMSSSCPSSGGKPAGKPVDILTGFVKRRWRGLWAARSVLPWTRPARCWSLTMSAI